MKESARQPPLIFITRNTYSRKEVTRSKEIDLMSNYWGEIPLRGSSRRDIIHDDEEALLWAALEKLPTYTRVRKSVLQCELDHAGNNDKGDHDDEPRIVDVMDLKPQDKERFIDRNFRVLDEDNTSFLAKLRDRLHRVGVQQATVEVRFEDLEVEAECYVGTRALPTLVNTSRNILESALGCCTGIRLATTTTHKILNNVSGIIRPSRMTLLLGPPSSGKTTLLKALAGTLQDPTLKVRGEITYNGHRLNEFVPRKTASYISQNDVHTGDLTVKETLDFSARFQGVGSKDDLVSEIVRREKEAGIHPDPEVDLFMKATALKGCKSNLITDYILKILGLDICKDIIVGDEMQRGISGGQKKRVTTGEMIVGPSRTLFMDEISTGLDSSTTFQIVKCLQQITHITEATILMSLLQPAPETYDLFDDIILLSEGHIVYQGPRENVLSFFEACGFKCPERKGTADFLQEVTSKKDQEQYWAEKSKPYSYISVSEFARRFKEFHIGNQLTRDLAAFYDKKQSHGAALVFSKYAISKRELLKASFDKEWLMIKRKRFVYVFKSIQLIILALVASTVFLRTTLKTTYNDGALYIGAMIFAMIVNMFNGFAELSLTVQRLPVFYKHRDLLFHPAWAFTIPKFLLHLPISFLESALWTVVSYYTIGFAPEASRLVKLF
ncbi:transcription factor [Dionaea muscipula]